MNNKDIDPIDASVHPASGYAGDVSPALAWAWVQSGEAELDRKSVV